MTERLTYLLSKDPVTQHGGDIQLVRLMMSMAREEFDVDVICLSSTPDRTDPDVVRVAKPRVSPARLALDVLSTRRSLVHTRYDVPAFADAIEESGSRTFVTEHSYMAEPFLRTRAADDPDVRLLVSTSVSEAVVWGATRGLLGRLQTPSILRDELRVARAATSVAVFDLEEAELYARHDVTATWLDLTFPSRDRVPVEDTPPRLVFLGDRTWGPNAEAARILLEWWPEIAAGVPGAELCLVGKPAENSPTQLPDGVRDLGFVDDLDGFLATCRGLAAPIRTGGGVRVKLLEALAIGLPVVSTSIGVGSLATLYDLPVADTREEFVARSRELLLDRDAAARLGEALWTTNAERWSSRAPHATLLRWLRGTS